MTQFGPRVCVAALVCERPQAQDGHCISFVSNFEHSRVGDEETFAKFLFDHLVGAHSML